MGLVSPATSQICVAFLKHNEVIMTNLALKLEPAKTALTFVQDGKVLTDSRTVAETFGKQHKDVFRRPCRA